MDGSIQPVGGNMSQMIGVDHQGKSATRADERLKSESQSTDIDSMGAVAAAGNPLDPVVKDELDSGQMHEIGKQLQEFLASLNKDLQFSIDEVSGQNVVRVYDQKTGDLIRQIPSEELLAVVSRLSEASGLFIKTQA